MLDMKKTRFILAFMLLILSSSQALAQKPSAGVPSSPDTTRHYLFYLHGMIIELQGIRPTSPRFGVYEYEKILQTFADSGFVVISEARKKGTQVRPYAQKVAAQIDSLLKAGVPARNITVLGASKGAGIAVMVSHLLRNEDIAFVLLAICNERMAAFWKKNGVQLWGRVLYFHDTSDGIAGSCSGYLKDLRSPGLKQFREIELSLGLGHGFLYRPLPDWVRPSVAWARGENPSPEIR